MARLHSISVPDAEEEFWKAFAESAKKEGGVSGTLLKLAKEWYRAHGEGNPSFSIKKWMEDSSFKALPTMGESLKNPKEWSEKDLEEVALNARARMQEAEFELQRRKDREWGGRR